MRRIFMFGQVGILLLLTGFLYGPLALQSRGNGGRTPITPTDFCSRIFVVLDLGAADQAGSHSTAAGMVGSDHSPGCPDGSNRGNRELRTFPLPRISSACDLRHRGLSCRMAIPGRDLVSSGRAVADDSFGDLAPPRLPAGRTAA